MKYFNTEDRKKRTRSFFLLYAFTVVLLALAGSAFFVPPPPAAPQVIVREKVKSPAVADTAAQMLDKFDRYNEISLEVDSLKAQLVSKEKEVKQLQEKIKPSGLKNKISEKQAKDVEFLKWALSSQSNEVIQLKKDNEKLKAQVKDLKKYLQ